MGITEALKSSKLGDVALPAMETPVTAPTPVTETPAMETPATKQYQLITKPVDRERLIQAAREAGLNDASRVRLDTLVRTRASVLASDALSNDNSLADNGEEYTALFIDAYTSAFLSRRGQ